MWCPPTQKAPGKTSPKPIFHPRLSNKCHATHLSTPLSATSCVCVCVSVRARVFVYRYYQNCGPRGRRSTGAHHASGAPCGRPAESARERENARASARAPRKRVSTPLNYPLPPQPLLFRPHPPIGLESRGDSLRIVVALKGLQLCSGNKQNSAPNKPDRLNPPRHVRLQ